MSLLRALRYGEGWLIETKGGIPLLGGKGRSGGGLGVPLLE